MSTNAWLRERATKTAFVRRSVSAFMPGERLEDAMAAAASQQRQGIATILTRLGENVTRADEAGGGERHYPHLPAAPHPAPPPPPNSPEPTQPRLRLPPGARLSDLSRPRSRAEGPRQL